MNKLVNISKKGFPAFSIILVFACLLVIGLSLLPLLPVKLNPSATSQTIGVSFSMGGQTAQVIEAEVTSKLEGLLSRIRGVERVSSQSSNGFGSITLQFSKHTNIEMARFEVSTVIRQAWPSLPDGVTYPTISRPTRANDGTNTPFLRYSVNAPFSPIQIQEYINNNLAPIIAEVRGVDRVTVTGAGQMIYRLVYDLHHLQNLNVSPRDIQAAISSYLSREFLGIGKIAGENGNENWIRIALQSDNNNTSFDPSLIQVRNNDGRILYLNQLVQTFYEEEAVSSMFRINGLNTIYLSIMAEEDANQLHLSRKVRQLLAELEKDLPHGYELHLLHDVSEFIQQEMRKIYFRSGLTVLLLLSFIVLIYRNVRYSLLILFSLIANVGIAVIFYYLFGLEIQLYSLAGLTISLTLIIDNAIIISDQIINRGNKKVFLAILTATLTSIGALAAILWLDQTMRANLEDFVWIIIINLAVSLFVAIFLVPALIEKMNVKKRVKKIKENCQDRRSNVLYRFFYKIRKKRRLVYSNRIYEKIIVFMYRKRPWFVAFIILVFGTPIFLLPSRIEPRMERTLHSVAVTQELGYWAQLYNRTLGSTFYREKIRPHSDIVLGGTLRLFTRNVSRRSFGTGERAETMIHVRATLPHGATIEQMDALIRRMENFIGQYPEVGMYETNISSGQRASIVVRFAAQYQRGSFPHLLRNKLITKALELGGGSWGVFGVGDGFSNDVRERAGSNRIRLLGYNYDQLVILAYELRDSLLANRRIKEVTIDSRFSWERNDYTEFVFDLEKERLAETNFSPNELYASSVPLFQRGINAGNWVSGGRTNAIRLFARQADEMDIWDLKHTPGWINERKYRLSNIASIEKRVAPRSIVKENQQYILCIQYDYIGSFQQEERVRNRMIEWFNRMAPLGYKAEVDEQFFDWGSRQAASKQYRLIFLIMVIIYFMTSFLFNSLKQPLVIISVIPISFIGLFLAFHLFRLNFGQGGFAGFVLLCALTVNANIYILDEYNNIRKRIQNITPMQAYIKAWNAKIRPIFLTVFSTILGFIPFLVGTRDAFWFPLAAGTIGGLIVSVMATFFFLPLFMGVGRVDKN